MKKTNLVAEYDELSNNFYIDMPPYSSKNKPSKIDHTQQIESEIGIICLDWFNGKLCGIEIPNARENVNLGQLNIKS